VTLWGDYSGGRPSGDALLRGGFSGVIRYAGMGNAGKRITAAEYKDLVATFGAENVHFVVELGTGDTWGSVTDDDRARGQAYARAGLADLRAAGVPDWVGVAGASDAHATSPWQITDTVEFQQGFIDVLGLARTGHYGFQETQVRVHDAGAATWFWRCGSEPSIEDKKWVNVWQRNPGNRIGPTSVTVSGVAVDVNQVYRPISGDIAMALELTTGVPLVTSLPDHPVTKLFQSIVAEDYARIANLESWFRPAGDPNFPEGPLAKALRVAGDASAPVIDYDKLAAALKGSAVAALSDADVARIAEAVLDEQHRRDEA
jgi:hypothetical protein